MAHEFGSVPAMRRQAPLSALNAGPENGNRSPHGSADVMLFLTTPHRDSPLPATTENIRSILDDLAGRANPYVILAGDDELAFMQTLWTPSGFQLEFQAGGLEEHYRATREDLSVAEVATAFEAYVRGDESGWRHAFFFRRVEVRSAAHLFGIAVGRFARRWRGIILLVLAALVSLGLWALLQSAG